MFPNPARGRLAALNPETKSLRRCAGEPLPPATIVFAKGYGPAR